MKKFLKYFLVGMVCLSAFACSDPLGAGGEDDDPILIPPPKPKPLAADSVNLI